MWRLIKALLVLAAAGFLALVGYAYLGDYAPTPAEVSRPVVLDAD